eukprot:tig00021719_g23165.t1
MAIIFPIVLGVGAIVLVVGSIVLLRKCAKATALAAPARNRSALVIDVAGALAAKGEAINGPSVHERLTSSHDHLNIYTLFDEKDKRQNPTESEAERRIRRAVAVVFALSPSSAASLECRKWVDLARRLNKPIFVAEYEQVSLEWMDPTLALALKGRPQYGFKAQDAPHHDGRLYDLARRLRGHGVSETTGTLESVHVRL